MRFVDSRFGTRVINAVYRGRLFQAIFSRLQRARTRRMLLRIKQSPVPQHIAIIMDGNRRFARKVGIDTREGHRMGRDKLEQVVDWCLELGVNVLTVYAFSTENFKRASKEVDYLMGLFVENFYKMADDPRVDEKGVRVRVIGQLSLLPERVREAAEYAMKKTENNKTHFYNIAIAYGGREEIINAVRRIAADVKDERLSPQEIDEETISRYLYTKGLPDPDLILRTSGEERVSNFLLWQMAYSELYFADIYWPALAKRDFLKAVESYQQRKRNYGK
ncbi:MAG: di-trans,poly-cis-decaprenylcistransferase [Thermoplasmata archaeon HGW-Thermoplasmata-1]|nr:MAG: di-trans,poly-cis-decaprenylcistransferase [Thermoplasmata archaeon HGW-Thermoplasmata-1]